MALCGSANLRSLIARRESQRALQVALAKNQIGKTNDRHDVQRCQYDQRRGTATVHLSGSGSPGVTYRRSQRAGIILNRLPNRVNVPHGSDEPTAPATPPTPPSTASKSWSTTTYNKNTPVAGPGL